MEEAQLVEFVRVTASGDTHGALALLDASPGLARVRAKVGASRQTATDYFFEAIGHYLYAGDSALHLAAASHDPQVVQRLIELGAQHSVQNRRGAAPLHYAADTNFKRPEAQAETIHCLCRAGADPNALDKSGVAPLHRAVRTRGAGAVEALLAHGADPKLPNKRGSAPLHLAVQNTGRGGSGSEHAIEQQRRIISLLLSHGAKATDRDARGKSVAEAATAEWVRQLIR